MKQLSNLKKKIRRKISRASKRGRYLVSRKGRRDRPGRKKGLMRKKLLEEVQFEKHPLAPKPFKQMNIPKMSKK